MTPQPGEALRDEELDDLREHFVNGSGAYTDSALVGRLVVEIDRLRTAAPVAGEGLDVERLAKAIWEVRAGGSIDNRHAADVARRYAALAANRPVAEREALREHERNLVALGKFMLNAKPGEFSGALAGELIAHVINGIPAVRAAANQPVAEEGT